MLGKKIEIGPRVMDERPSQRFQNLYAAHYQPIRDFLLDEGCTKETARDLSLDILMKASASETVIDEMLPRLLADARKLLTQHIRSLRNDELLVWRLTNEFEANPFSDDDPFEAALIAQGRSHLHRMLSDLSGPDAEVLVLHLQGLSIAGIAKIQGRSQSRVGRSLRLAIQELAARAGSYQPMLDGGRRYPLAASFDRGPRSPDGQLLLPASPELKVVQSVIVKANDLLLQTVARKPELLYTLEPIDFERLVAELLEDMGYRVEQTPLTRDGGVDLWVVDHKEIGTFKYAVQCKRHARHNKVGVRLVRELLGVVQATRVTAGLLVTTSYFTRDARELQAQAEHRVQLHDYLALVDWLQAHGAEKQMPGRV